MEIVDDMSSKLEKDSDFKGKMNDQDIMKQNEFFSNLSEVNIKRLLSKKTDIFLQKDEAVVKSYEKQKFIYLVTRGEIYEQYKNEQKTHYKKQIGFGGLAGVGSLLMNHKKQLEYFAIARSVVSLFCFPINEIK